MEQRNSIKYNFIAQVFILFAFDVIFLMAMAILFGDGAKEISKIYSLGSKGLSINTLLQFLLSSFVVIFFKTIFFSEHCFKNMMALWRTVLMLFSILTTIIVFIIVFDWFPLNNLEAWTGFILCFVLGFFGSVTFMLVKTKIDNKRYDELLLNYKNQHTDVNVDE